MGSLNTSSAQSRQLRMKFLVLLSSLSLTCASVLPNLVANAPAHHFQAATAPADHFLAATAPASHFQAATAPADHFLAATAPASHFHAATAPAFVEQFPALAPAAAYTAGAPAAAYYTNPQIAPAAVYTAGAPHAASYTNPYVAPVLPHTAAGVAGVALAPAYAHGFAAYVPGLVAHPNGAIVPVDEPAVAAARADHLAALAAAY